MSDVKVPLKINYVVYTKVRSVYQVGAFWYVHFEGSWEALRFGETKPFQRNDDIKITFEKVDPCPPSQTTNLETSPSSS